MSVLNAFRHHWNLHPEFRISGVLGIPACSTPFGIIGIFTCAQSSAPRPIHVLNAFRHHWNLHANVLTTNSRCSSVLNAFRHHWNLHLRLMLSAPIQREGAQRLSASLESSHKV